MSTAQLRRTTLPVSSPYGWRILKKTGKKNLHKGTDFPFGKTVGVSAFGSGRIKHAGWGTGANAERGLYVEIEHAPGIATSYHSLSGLAPGVRTGAHINMGDILGFGGTTAAGATGSHCHVGLWLNGQHVDLEKYLTPGQTVTISNTGAVSGAGSTPFNNTPPAPPKPKETDMKHIYHPDRGYALIWDEGAYGYPNDDIDAIVAKGIEPSIKYDYSWQWDTEVREANIRGAAMRALQTADTIKALKAAGLDVDIDEEAIARATANLISVPAVDVQKLAAALAAAGASLDVSSIAAAVEASLKDDFANIPKAVNDDSAKRMQS